MFKAISAFLLLSTTALAAPTLPPGEPQIADPLASLVSLDRDLQNSRLASKTKTRSTLGDFREELQLSVNGHEADMEKLPLAPDTEESPAKK
jgi:hypothetical protein